MLVRQLEMDAWNPRREGRPEADTSTSSTEVNKMVKELSTETQRLSSLDNRERGRSTKEKKQGAARKSGGEFGYRSAAKARKAMFPG